MKGIFEEYQCNKAEVLSRVPVVEWSKAQIFVWRLLASHHYMIEPRSLWKLYVRKFQGTCGRTVVLLSLRSSSTNKTGKVIK